MRSIAPPRRWTARAGFWVAAAVALLVAHDGVTAVQVGPGEGLARALRQGGHAWWGAASAVIVAGGALATVLVLVRLARLRALGRRLEAPTPPLPARSLLNRWLPTWGRLLAVVAIGFVVQENVEHALSHRYVPGIGILLGPESPLALPVLAAITALAAIGVAAISATERALAASIEAALGPSPRAPRSLGRPPLALDRARPSPLAAAAAGRAPPPLLAHA